jgi:photosystem II stability/assembly factor-like uncharacterized protein
MKNTKINYIKSNKMNINDFYKINTIKMKNISSKTLKMVFYTFACAILLSAITSDTAFSQWGQVNTLTNVGSFPSISMVTDNIFFIAGGPSGTPYIYKTTNGGATFSSVSTTGITLELYSIWAVDVNTIYVGDGGAAGGGGGNANVYKTTNGGTNWTVLFSTGGTNGFIYGIVFSRTNPQIGIIQSDPPTGVGNAFWLAKTTNGGANWTTSSPSGVSGNLSAQNSLFIIDQNFYGFGLNLSPQMRYTTNGGTTWLTKTMTGAQGSTGFVTSIAFNNNKLNGVSAGYGTYSTIGRTTDGGNTWFAQAIPNTIPDGNNFGELKWVPGYNTVYLIVSSSSATQSFKSTDNGATWTSVQFPAIGGVTHMDLSYFSNKAQVSSVSSTGSVMKLQDSPLPVSLESFTYNVSGRDVNLKWVTTVEENNAGFEVYRISSDLNASDPNNWLKVGYIKGNGNKNTPTNYNFTDSKLPSGKYNYRIKQIDYNGNYEYFTLNGIAKIENSKSISLHQNYPNPFNPTTNIDYDLSADSKVTLKVYDISGREVLTLVNDQQKAGFYTVKFNATNLSSGTYFYKLFLNSNGSDIVITKKMTVIK